MTSARPRWRRRPWWRGSRPICRSEHCFTTLCFSPPLPHDEIRIESQGKGEVRDPTGKVAPIEFDWQLTPTAAHVRSNPNPGDPVGNLFALFTTLTLVDADLPAQDVEPKPVAAKYSELKFSLKNASLAEFIKNENLKLPFSSDGKISLQLKASIPLDRLDDLKAYQAKGSAQIKQFTAAGMKLEEVSADFTLRDGVLKFESLHGAFAKQGAKIGDEGVLSGSGQIQLAPLGEMRANLKLDKVPLAKIAGQSTDLMQGNLSGMLSIRGNADKLQDAKGLEAEGRIVGSPLNIYGIGVDEFATSLKLKDGVLALPGLQARIEGELITPTASLQLKVDHSVVAKIALENWDLGAIRKIAASRQISIPPVTGKLRAEAVLRSKPAPDNYTISGDIEAKNVKIDAAALDDLRLHWELDGNNINLNAALYDGKMAGTASLPTDGKVPGKLDLHVQGIDVKRLTKHLHLPVAIDGIVDGTLKATFTPAAKDNESKAVFRVDFTSPRLRVQNIPTDKLQGTLEYQRGKIGYNLTGSSLGGSFDLQGEVPGDADAANPKREKANEGRLGIKGIRLGQLLDALGASAARDMRGRVNLDLPFSHNTTDRFPQGKGKLRVTDVQWGDLLLTESISAEILLADHQLRVHNLEGDLAQGTLSGQLAYDFREPERSRFSLNLDGVESGYLLAPWLEKKMEGSVQARIRGRLGRTWTGTADIALAHGKFSGLEFSDWRLPISWSFAPSQGRVQAEIQETTAQFARGRANGKLKFSWDNGARVEGLLRLDRVELGELLRQTIGSSSLGAGRTTAKLDIKGTDVRSLNEFEGNLVATFEQAQALQVPVLQQISPFLGLSASTTFQKGTLNARLERGTAKIKQLTLQGNNVQVNIDGAVNLREQLNLHVIARTGDIGWPTVRLGPIGVRVPVAGPVPFVVLQEVSALISNHVVYLDVTGTPASPTIRPRPLQTLSAEAARFFLNPSNSPITLDP